MVVPEGHSPPGLGPVLAVVQAGAIRPDLDKALVIVFEAVVPKTHIFALLFWFYHALCTPTATYLP